MPIPAMKKTVMTDITLGGVSKILKEFLTGGFKIHLLK